jgi:UDP-glucuronate decarboxylase
MKLLVTGGAGFLGSHLCEKLLASGHDVICIDNYYTGSKVNISQLMNNPKFKSINHDVTVPMNLEVDGIFNLACPASPLQYQKDPVQTLKTSVLGALNILELAKRTGARVLQASTSEIYGDPEVMPQTEEYWGRVNPIGIRSCYDEGKRAAETLFFDSHRQFNVNMRIARIFNTYGPRMQANDGRVVSNFIVQALANESITIYGNGEQTRSFCYVDDLIEGMIQLFFSEGITTPINLGNPKPITIKTLANEIIELTKSKSKINYEDLPSDDPVQRQPDITKANKLLNWQPKINRENGLIKTIEYFKKELK